jgi:signal peptidase II
MQKKYSILLGLTSSAVVLDQATKYWIHHTYRLGESTGVLNGFFNITYVRNTGAAFGLLAHADPSFRIPFFVVMPMVALAAIGFIFRRIADTDLKLSVALSLVIGGAIGNLIDRLVYGYVIDFLDFHWRYRYHFPAFNVADIAICVGVGVLMLDLFRQDNSEGNSGKGRDVSASG